MERKIGETFEYKGKIYKVAEMPEYFCVFCDLEKECSIRRSYLENVAGTCSPSCRNDARNVCFKEIKKDMEIKDNQLTINIPDGMEIDLQNSNFGTGVIKFKKKEITYEDIEFSLKLNENMTGIDVANENVNKLCAISRLMCIAKFYNGDWKPDWSNERENKYYICYIKKADEYIINCINISIYSFVYFKHKEDAQAVINNPNFREILDAIFKN